MSLPFLSSKTNKASFLLQTGIDLFDHIEEPDRVNPQYTFPEPNL